MSEQGKFSDKAIYKVLIDAPIETVWSVLVTTNSPLPFFFGSVCETPGLSPGAPIRMRSPNGKYTSVVGDVLEFDPPYRYVHTFKFTNFDDPPCKVTYELKETPDGVEFSLITENVVADTKTENSMKQGGVFITKNLKSFVETGKPTLGGRMILAIIGVMTPFSPKSTRSENWPMDLKI